MKFGPILSFALAAVFPLLANSAIAATPEVSSRPILFIHGFNPFGLPEDCKKDWGNMESSLTAQGYSGQKVTIGYYALDTNCDVKTSPHGTILTKIEDLSKDLAWYVYDQYSSKGVSVDIVTHSMGGLILRYALYRTAISDSSFPPYMMVTHAATLAAPFTGYSLLAEFCHVNVLNIQCDEMFPLSSFIEGLKDASALVPQGPDGTIWSDMGSNADFTDSSDGFVGSDSATSMDIPASSKIILPWHMFVFHTMYTRNKTVIADVSNSLAVTAQDVEAQDTAAPKTAVQRSVASTRVTPRFMKMADAVISREEILQDLSQLPDDQKPAKTESHLENNEPAGVLFTNVLAGGLFDRMGIQEGDIVRGCKAENINSPFDALQSFNTTSDPVALKFCVMRNGTLIKKRILVH